MDLGHEDGHTEQDIRLVVVVDVEVDRDVDHNHCDEDSGMCGDMVAVCTVDDCSTMVVLADLLMKW